jgi:hypothetical protein
MNERIQELVERFAQDFLNRSGYDMREYEPFLEESRIFAESLVKSVITDLEKLHEGYANPGTYESDEYYVRQAAKEVAMDDAMSTIRHNFGVKS